MGQEPHEVAGAPGPDRPTVAATAPLHPATTTEIRSQIDRTRAEMGETFDAIQARLRPTRLMTDAKQTVKEAIVGRVKRFAQSSRRKLGNARGESTRTEGILRAVKNHPVPVAIAGVASATALVLRASKRSRTHTDGVAEYMAEAYPWQRRTNSNGNGRISSRFLVGACAGLACWGAWRARRAGARFSALDNSDIAASELAELSGARLISTAAENTTKIQP